MHVYVAFGQGKSDGQSVASRQQALTATYERLLQAAEVSTRQTLTEFYSSGSCIDVSYLTTLLLFGVQLIKL